MTPAPVSRTEVLETGAVFTLRPVSAGVLRVWVSRSRYP